MQNMYDAISSNKWKSAMLMSLFFAIVMGMGFLIGLFWDWEGAIIGIVIASLIALIMAFTSYYKSDTIALSVSGAKPATKAEYPYYVNTVEGLAIAAGLPMPRPYIIETPAINAFATGRDPEHSAIAVTRGLLERCNRLELEGVIAHEMSHIKNYDIRLMSMVVVLVGVIVIMADVVVRWIFWGSLFGGRDRGGGSSGGGAFQVVLLIVGIVFIILSPIIAQLLQFAISRKREYLADANGALLTRYPEGLASALERISSENIPYKNASKATAHMFFSEPVMMAKDGHSRKKQKTGKTLFDTHPPIEERVKRLRQMAGQPGMRTTQDVMSK